MDTNNDTGTAAPTPTTSTTQAKVVATTRAAPVRYSAPPTSTSTSTSLARRLEAESEREYGYAPPPPAGFTSIAAQWAPPSSPEEFVRVDQHGDPWYWDCNARVWVPQQQIQMPEEEDYAALLESTTAAASAPPSKRAKHSKQHQHQQPSSARNANPSSTNDATSQKPTTPSVYLTGLPSDDQLTEDEVALFCSKCGIVKKDPYTGELEVRLMPGDGAAVVNYFRAESVDLALMILDGTLFRDRYPIAVTRATPEQAAVLRKKRKKRDKKKIVVDQSKELSWDEESRVHVILKNMYSPDEAWTDTNFFKDLKDDIKEEVEKLGKLETIGVFEYNPEGIVALKFKEPEAAAACIAKMDGRFFAGRQVEAFYYDGQTNYHRDETPEMAAQREAAWTKWLEEGGE